MFAGQGAQRAGMGAGAGGARARCSRRALDEACGRWSRMLGWPVRGGGAGRGRRAAAGLDQTVFAQPGLFAVMVALAAAAGSRAGSRRTRWRGIRSGEIAAAYVAGVLSLEDACALVAARGRG